MSDLPGDVISDNRKLLHNLAKEIAYGVFPLEDILKHHKLSVEQFEEVKRIDYFQRILQDAVESWNSATNTSERTKLKISAMVEEVLPDMHARLLDDKTADAPRVELFKTLLRSAGLYSPDQNAGGASGGQRISISINVGDDKPVSVTKDVTPRVIELEESYEGAEE